MAQNRGRQRGMVKMASSVLLAAFGALLGAPGCASDEGSGGGETLGVSAQAITCSQLNPCPRADGCASWTCNFTLGMCVPKVLVPDGEKCQAVNGETGVCVGNQCCPGCYIRTKAGYECHSGNQLGACGLVGTACQDCSGTDTCTAYSCIAEKGACDQTPIPDGKPCSDNSGICSGGACCAGCVDGKGICQPGNLVTQCGLSNASTGLVKCKSCDDGNVCNNDACVRGVCAAPTPKAGSCADANLCNGSEVCGNGACNPGTPLVCNDNNPCTVDSCDPATGCKFTAVEAGTSCDNDANKCNGTAKCEGTVCKPQAPVDCDDSNVCTTDSCAPLTGLCVHTNNALDCSDNDLCTLVDKCSGGKCVGAGAPNCNDNEFCTTDTCDKAKGCVHTALANDTGCDDGNNCSQNDKCINGKCSFVMGKDCNDNNSCTIDACSANVCGPVNQMDGTPCVFDRCHVNSDCQAGKCSQGDLINCDDGNPCTTDSCDIATGCKHVNVDGGDCSDNDLCTTTDKCAAGKCVGTAVECQPIDECHLAGACNAKTGTCDDPRAPDDTACQKGAGTCQTGKCEVTSMGGAGGDGPTGEAGQATGGTAGTAGSAQGGAPATGEGGEGNAPTNGGDSTTGATSGKGTGATSPNGEGGEEGGARRAFVREPGGCACSLPASDQTGSLAWLGGLALAGLLAGRRRGRAASSDLR